MKKLIALLLIVVSLAGCKKDHCIGYTDQNGDFCCEKCFRSERKMLKYTEDNPGIGCNACD